MIDSSFFPFF